MKNKAPTQKVEHALRDFVKSYYIANEMKPIIPIDEWSMYDLTEEFLNIKGFTKLSKPNREKKIMVFTASAGYHDVTFYIDELGCPRDIEISLIRVDKDNEKE